MQGICTIFFDKPNNLGDAPPYLDLQPKDANLIDGTMGKSKDECEAYLTPIEGLNESIERETLRRVRFVWRSTPASVHLAIPSALGAFEVIGSVVAWWAYAIYFDTFTHLWVSICVAPLLLLRSNNSISVGVNWFSGYMQTDIDPGISTTVYEGHIRDVGSLRERWSTRTFILCGIVVFGCAVSLRLNAVPFEAGFWSIIGTAIFCSYLFLIFVVAFVGIKQQSVRLTTFLMLVFMGLIISAFPVWILVYIIPPQISVVATSYELTADTFFVIAKLAIEVAAVIGLIFFSPLIDSLDAILYPISVAFGVVLRSFCVRILATIRFIRIGFWQIPENFRNSLFVVDVYEPARLIPAYKNILTIAEDIVCRIDYRHFRPFSYGRDEDPETEVP